MKSEYNPALHPDQKVSGRFVRTAKNGEPGLGIMD